MTVDPHVVIQTICRQLMLLLFATTACSIAFAQPNSSTAVSTRNRAQQEPLLFNIPTNSDNRCVGISVVSEVLLDSVSLEQDGYGELPQLGKQIYDNLLTGQSNQYPRKLMIKGTLVPTKSKTAIDNLSTLVAERYKTDYLRLLETEEGKQKLLGAQNDFIETFSELEKILDADIDKIDVFCGIGSRVFPDGTVKETAHAFLIGKKPKDGLNVYDPNDPGLPISCQILSAEGGLAIEWTCQYRDTGHITIQRYRITHKDKYFRAFRQ